MPGAFDGKDAWWLLGRPVVRMRDIEPLFTPEVIGKIHSHLNSIASVDKRILRNELLTSAGYYFYVKDLYTNHRPSALRKESKRYMRAFEKTLNITLSLSSGYLFNLILASGYAISALDDDKLAECDDDYLFQRWVAFARHKNAFDLIYRSLDGLIHLAMVIESADEFLKKEKDVGGQDNKNEPIDCYVVRLGNAFTRFTGRSPGYTFDPSKNVYKGDFVKFVDLNLQAVERDRNLTNIALGQVIKHALGRERHYGRLKDRRGASTRTKRTTNPKRSQQHNPIGG